MRPEASLHSGSRLVSLVLVFLFVLIIQTFADEKAIKKQKKKEKREKEKILSIGGVDPELYKRRKEMKKEVSMAHSLSDWLDNLLFKDQVLMKHT